MLDHLLEPGEPLERWLIEDRIVGSWGVVYVMRDLDYQVPKRVSYEVADRVRLTTPAIGRPQVLIGKTLRPEYVGHREWVEQFERECHAWLSLAAYKHIVRLYTVDRFFDQAFALGEWIPDEGLPNTLRGWIAAGLLDLELALRYGMQICRALAYARDQGVVAHHDLKPENVMMTRSGVAKVTDWGLSRMVPAQRRRASVVATVPYAAPHDLETPGLRGTSGYIAPEVEANGELSPAADVFSFGVLFLEMISAARPAPGPGAAEIARYLHVDGVEFPALATVLAACLASDPGERPPLEVIQETIASAFESLTGVPIEAPPGTEWTTGADIGQRSYALFMLGETDQAMALQKQLIPGTGEKAPLILFDYKSHGFVPIVPSEIIEESEAKAAESDEHLEFAISTNDLAGRLDRALELSLRALALRPDDEDRLFGIADLLARLGRWEEGLGYIDEVIRRSPTAEHWIRRLGYCERAGNTEEVLRSAYAAASAGQDNAKARGALGHTLEKLGRVEEALEHFRAAVELEPADALAWFNLATCEARLGAPEHAIELFTKVVELHPTFHQAFNSRGAMKLSAGLIQEAVLDFRRALELEPHYARPWVNLAQVALMRGQNDEAIAALRRAVAIDPNHAMARDALAQLTG